MFPTVEALINDCRFYNANMYDVELEIQFNLPTELRSDAWDAIDQLEENNQIWPGYYK